MVINIKLIHPLIKKKISILIVEKSQMKKNPFRIMFFMCARHGIYLGGESPLWGTHHPTTREAQGACREARARGSVYQNLGSTNRNLIPRLYRRTRLHNKLKSKRCA